MRSCLTKPVHFPYRRRLPVLLFLLFAVQCHTNSVATASDSAAASSWYSHEQECFWRTSRAECISAPNCVCMWCQLPRNSTFTTQLCGTMASWRDYADPDVQSRCTWNETVCKKKNLYETCKSYLWIRFTFVMTLIVGLNVCIFAGFAFSGGTNTFCVFASLWLLVKWSMLAVLKNDRSIIPPQKIIDALLHPRTRALLAQNIQEAGSAFVAKLESRTAAGVSLHPPVSAQQQQQQQQESHSAVVSIGTGTTSCVCCVQASMLGTSVLVSGFFVAYTILHGIAVCKRL